MSADIVRFTHNVSGELKKLGCEFVSRLDDTNAAWKTPWGVLFFVADFGEDDKCPTIMWYDVLAGIEKSRGTLH